jgi:hypothetical protein
VRAVVKPADQLARASLSGQVKTGQTGVRDEAVRGYRDEIASEYRPVFDRLHRLIVTTCPDAEMVLSYAMPIYRIGRRRLNGAVWEHGLPLYVSPRGDGGSPGVTPSWPPGRGPSGSGLGMRRASPMKNSPIWCAPLYI